jgi:hypothetical protein
MTGEITLIRETSLQVLALFNQLQKDVKVSWRFLHIKSIWLWKWKINHFPNPDFYQQLQLISRLD